MSVRQVHMPSLTPLARFAALVFVFLSAILVAPRSQALPADPAARGLDLFIHTPTEVAPGGSLELTTEVFGFASVTEARPLANAVVEVGWDPESLHGAAPPPNVEAKTDAEGRARLVVPVPSGSAASLSLLVGARSGSHSRTHSVTISRSPPSFIELHTADSRVVPTSTVSAWARVFGPSGKPLAGAPVIVSLLEGGVARHSQRLLSDKGGLVMARVPIPRVDEPVWQWTLRAQSETGLSGAADVELTPREETPGMPTLEARWDAPPAGALAGDKIPFAIRLRDATNQPLVDYSVSYWIGPKGQAAPATDEEWKKQATVARTDGAGVVNGTRDAPTLVKSTGTSMHLVAKTVIEGHALESKNDVSIGVPAALAEITPEAEAIVPGLTQKLLVRVLDGRGEGVAAKFKVTGDGLAQSVTTDAKGEAEVTWNAPRGVGATRNVGPCAGGVAAAVTIRQEGDVPALRNNREGFTLCVSINRDAEGLVRVEPNVARPGDKVKVTVLRNAPNAATKRSFSAVARANHRPQAIATWLEGRADGSGISAGEVTLPADAGGGIWTLSAVLPEGGRASRMLSTALLVVPKIAPLLTAKRVGGRAAPGGKVEIEAVLSDGHGQGLPGAVSAIVVDAFGGANARVNGLDTRLRLCAEVGTFDDRCTAILEGDPKTDTLRRTLMSKAASAQVRPSNDPGEHASTALRKSFAEVVHSLEGAVFEATKSAQTLIDVRRKENGRWTFNPEMFTLVTDAMNEPPMTPGGEKLTLPDLSAVDPQVTFDNVARRVTRLKLFRILHAVRDVRTQRSLDPDEPVFKDPNALLRRLVRSGALTEDLLLDPWGGTIQYVRATSPPVPFLSTIRNFELRAPGPDGVINTGDDVKDPFERVLKSGSPYASAVEEDRIVDAKWDMVVSDETVNAWQHMFDELTGTEMGGLGLSGVGEGGGGRGEGIGLGNIGTIGHGSGTGTGRGSGAIATGDAYWSPPLRTDAEGRVKLTIPLGDAETTWRIALVGTPDGLEPASTTLDVASEVPLSARVDVGARWVAGDVVETNVTVRNRSKNAIKAAVTATAEGAAALETPNAAPILVDVPANGARQVRVKVRARHPGEAALVITTKAQGGSAGAAVVDDVLRHTWEVVPPGEKRVLTQTAWVDGDRELGIAIDNGYALMGEPRVVLERGYDDPIAAALDSLEPERQTSAQALADALEAAILIERWATTKNTPRHRALGEIAHTLAASAQGRFEAYAKLDDASRGPTARNMWTLRARVRMLTKQQGVRTPEERAREAKEAKDGRESPLCPPIGEDAEATLDVEPAPVPDVLPCWGAFVSTTVRSLENSRDAVALARAILALADRPHRANGTKLLAEQLRRVVKLQSSGDITSAGESPGVGLEGRAARALVYAALLRAYKFGTSPASQDVLFGRIASLRDVTGGYGSSVATVHVVRALLSSQLEGHGTTRARVRVQRSGQGPFDKQVDVPASGFINVALPANTLDVQVETEGPGLIARFERPVLRSWTRPPPVQASPVSVEIVWPAEAKAGSTGTLRVMLRQDLVEQTRAEETVQDPKGIKSSVATMRTTDISEVDVRIPLPPGVTLAAPTPGVMQLQGVLAIREAVSHSGSTVEVPIRFGLAGKVTVPEAIARMTRRPIAPATAPSRSLVVR